MIVPARGIEWYMPQTANVNAETFTSDSGGGATSTITPGTDTPCRLDALGGDEGEVAARISDRSTHLLTLPAGTAVTTDQTISIDGLGTWEVVAVRSYPDELTRAVEVVART